MRPLFLSITIVILSIVFVHHTVAADFRVAFATTYTFSPTGSASVNKKVTLTNLTTNTYPEEYFLELPGDSESVVAFDDGGKTETSIVEENGQKKAKVVLNQETLGFGNSVTIALSYETATLAAKNGTKWSIAIPGFSSAEEVDEYVVSISFPEMWGSPKRVIPPPERNYVWTLTERPESPINLEFEEISTPTAIPSTTTSSVVPVAVGLSIGVVGFVVLFELLKRIA